MEPRDLERCRRRLSSRWPLLGGWLRRRAATALARDGSPAAVGLLADAVLQGDVGLRELALGALARRAGEGCGEAREALCRLAVHHADAGACAAALAGGHAPREPGPRALFYFLTAQWERYEALDFDRGLLRAAYRAADGRLRQRIAEAARRAGRVEWVEAVTRDAPADMLAELGDPGWQATVEVLSAARQWPEMWRLAQEAPAAWAARLLNRLREAGWQPVEPAEFEELVWLAKRWETPGLFSLPRARAVAPERAVDCSAIALSPDGRLLACATRGGGVELHRLPEGNLLRSLAEAEAEFAVLTFSLDGRLLAGRDTWYSVYLWDCEEGRLLRTWRPERGKSGGPGLSLGGRVLVSGGTYGPLLVWDLQAGCPLSPLQTEEEHLDELALSPDGNLLAGAGLGGVQVWELPSGRRVRTLRPRRDGAGPGPGTFFRAECLLVSSDGQVLAATRQAAIWHGREVAAMCPCTIWRWALPEGVALPALRGHSSPVRCLAFSPDRKQLASSDHGETVRLWDLPKGDCLGMMSHDLGHVQALRTTPNGLALAGSVRRIFADVLRLGGGAAPRATAECPQPAHALALSRRGQVLAGGSEDGKVWLWDPLDGRTLRALATGMGWVSALAVSPDGALLALADTQGHVQLWNLAAGERVRSLEGGRIVTCLAFSAGGGMLAGGTEAGDLYQWDLPEGGRLPTLQAHRGMVDGLAFSPDGALLASTGNADEEGVARPSVVRLWGLPGLAPLGELEGHLGRVFSLAFAPDGRVLGGLDVGQAYALCGPGFFLRSGRGPDQAVCLWESSARQLRERVSAPQGSLECLAFGSDGWVLGGLRERYLVRLWTSELLRLSRVPAGRISADERAWLDEKLRDPGTAEGERRAVELIAVLARHRRRFDIHLADAPPRAEPGPTDIEIAK
jgi:WD40 repeat protein